MWVSKVVSWSVLWLVMMVWMSTCLHTSSQRHSKLSMEVKAGWKGEQRLVSGDILLLGLICT